MPLILGAAAVLGGLTYFFGSAIWSMSLGAIVGGLATFLSWVIGQISVVVTSILFAVATYNGFINEEVVIRGWQVVRDLSNMFFILILLIIAFATILRVENYSMKRLLPKLLIMAILINFSRTICGLAIDLAQVIMLTFVNAFGSAGPGNLYNAFGLQNLWTWDTLKATLDPTSVNANTGLAVTGSMVLGLILLIIATIVISIFSIILIFRIIMLWILVILSPIAFMAMSFPAGARYASQWSSEFTKYVIVGPVMAFFLWLALTISTTTLNVGVDFTSSGNGGGAQIQSLGTGSVASRPGNMKQFLVTTLFLVAGLIMAQQSGAAGGSIAGRAVARIKTTGTSAGMLPWRGTKALGGLTVDKLHQKTGIDLNLARVWKGVKGKMADNRADRYESGRERAGQVMQEKGRIWGALALTGTPERAWKDITSRRGIGQRIRGGKYDAGKRRDLEKMISAKEIERGGIYTTRQKQEILKDVEIKQGQSSEIGEKIKKGSERLSTVQMKPEESAKLTSDLNNLKERKTLLDAEIGNLKSRADKMIPDDDKATSVDTDIEKLRDKMNRYIPEHDTETKSATEAQVREKGKKIDGIEDSDELLRIMTRAFQDMDKHMVMAVTRKMSKNGDENEYLGKFVGRNDYAGLQIFARALAGKLSKEELAHNPRLSNLKSGFSEQEAFSLGSEIAMLAKANKKWTTAGAFNMKDGEWRQMDHKEHASFVERESIKVHSQDLVRKNGRNAYGYEDETGYHIDIGGIKILQNLDNENGIKRIMEDMNLSAAKYLATYAAKDLQKLQDNKVFSEALVKAILSRAKKDEGGARAGMPTDELNKILES
jgi:hypothetical protein